MILLMDEVGLGKAIQRARQAAGYTQQQLCSHAEISYSTLAKIERGAIKTPSVFTVVRIASVLGVSLDTLLGSSGVVSPARAHHNSTNRTKKTSASGLQFLYVDINGCLVQFYHAAFSRIANDTGVPADSVETAFWHYNDAVCRGDLSLAEFNNKLAEHLGIATLDWPSYYLEAVQPIREMHDCVRWAAEHYRVGLLSNIMPTQIDSLRARNLIPALPYDVVIDSSAVGAIKPERRIYEIAQEQAGVDPSSILFIDDSRANLMAAEQLGWRVMWFDDMNPQASVAKIKAALAL